jgi:hypothetical protein
MLAQYQIDLKRHFLSATNIVVYAALVILMLGTFFAQTGKPNTTQAGLYSDYAASGDALSNEIIALRKQKHRTASENERLAQKVKERSYFDQIIMTASAGPATDVDQLNAALLNYAKYTQRVTAADPHVRLQLIKYTGESLDRSLLGRTKEVTFYNYLLKHHIREIPVGAIHAPATNYLTYAFLYHVSPFLIIAVFLVAMAELFTLDKREENINFTNILPISKFKVLLTRVLVSLTLYIPLFLAAVLSVFVVTGLHNGWGAWDYPLVYSLDGKHALIMTLAQFMLRFIGLIFTILLFFIVLNTATSLFWPTVGTNFIIAGAVLLTGLPAVIAQSAVGLIAKFLPSAYFDYAALIVHQTSWSTFGYFGGITVLLSWTTLILIGGFGVVHRRQVL